MPTFLDGVLMIAYNQDNAIAGYVEDTSDQAVEIHRLEDAIDEILDTVLGSLEVEEDLPVWMEWWTLSTPNGQQHKFVSEYGQPCELPSRFVSQIISRLGKRSDGTQLKWSQRFVTGEKNTIQIRIIHELDNTILQIWHECMKLQNEQIVRADPELLRNEVPVGSYDHLWDRYGQVQLQPIQGPREIGKPLSTNLMYHYSWPDGHEVRTLRKIYQ